LTLNRQERLNARWFGHFKQAAYQLAAEESALNAWQQLRVFSDRQVARMKEVELTSDVLVAIIKGISDIKEIAAAYRDFDEVFPARDSAMTTFRTTLSFVTQHLSEPVRTTRFRTLAWFYNLMVAIADAKVGIPNGGGPKQLQPGQELCQRMHDIDQALRQIEPPPGLANLYATLSQATSHVRERKIRHNYFFKMLTLAEQDWCSYWNQLTTA